jgi:hypothetical protein
VGVDRAVPGRLAMTLAEILTIDTRTDVVVLTVCIIVVAAVLGLITAWLS